MLQLREARLAVAAVAEQPLEHRRAGCSPSAAASSASPRHRVDVDAAVAALAVADDEVRLERELERASGVSLPSSRAAILIDRRAGLDVGAFGPLGRARRSASSRSTRECGPLLASSGSPAALRQAADDGHLVAEAARAA